MRKSLSWYYKMAYSLKTVYSRFENEITELDRLVLILSIAPESIDRDTHIEGCFIRLVVCWEQFIEEYFLRCMCKATTRNNSTIKPQGVATRNIDDAFKKINKYRKGRDEDFTDWLDTKQIQQRINDHFRKNSRVQIICESPEKLFGLRIVRNAIAHRSAVSIKKFEKLVKDQMGYLSVLNPTMASLLVQKNRNTNVLIFTLFSNYFMGLAARLTK